MRFCLCPTAILSSDILSPNLLLKHLCLSIAYYAILLKRKMKKAYKMRLRPHSLRRTLFFLTLFNFLRRICTVPASRTAFRTSRTSPSALSTAEFMELTAHDKKNRDRQNHDNNNIRHSLLRPFLPHIDQQRSRAHRTGSGSLHSSLLLYENLHIM